MSYGEPIALRGQIELEQVATAPSVESRSRSEAEFIERLKEGDAAAFNVLVSERSGEIYGLLYRLTENSEEARHLTQETFLKAFQNIGSFRGDADLRTWIYRIAINQARNRWRWWRRRRRDATVSIDSTESPEDRSVIARLATSSRDPEEAALANERQRTLRSALQSVGRVYREAVILRDIEGFSYEEIATLLEISVGTVKSRLARGRQALKRRLESVLGPKSEVKELILERSTIGNRQSPISNINTDG